MTPILIKKYLPWWGKFIDRLNDTDLLFYAHTRKDAKKKITAVSTKLVENLAKLLIGNQTSNDEYIDEVNQVIETIQAASQPFGWGTLSGETIYTWLIFDSPPHYDSEFLNTRIEYWQKDDATISINDVSREDTLNTIFGIVRELCQAISDNPDWCDTVDIRNYLPKEIYQWEPDVK